MSSMTSHVLRSRLANASLRASPRSASISTGVGTRGGHRPSSRRATSRAAAAVVRSARRDTPPESRTSTSAGHLIGSSRQSTGNCLGPGGLLWRGLPDFIYERAQVGIGGLEEFLPSEFDPDRLLQKPGRGETAFFDRSIEIVGEVHLHSRHTPKYTHLWWP